MIPGLNPTRAAKLITLGLLLFIGLIATSALAPAAAYILGDGTRETLLAQSALQAVFAFILPALICNRIFFKDAATRLGITTPTPVLSLLAAVACMAVAIPALNEVIALNASAVFPESIDAMFRKWEETSAALTSTMLATDSIGGLMSGILVIGVLTGFAEELFFRGALQTMLKGDGVGMHGAIWIAAVVFSVMHFQPFGFFPRLLLGAFFGYLFAWSGSIWLPAILHALNNSTVVFTSWLGRRGCDTSWYETMGTPAGDSLWLAALSVVATSAMLYLCSKIIKKRI